MFPIFEQGAGSGIGHSLDSFLDRFEEICRDHLEIGRAKAFAFILYDFHDCAVRKMLKNLGVFAKLDRLAANSLSVFYLDTKSERSLSRFNNEILEALPIEESVSLPCVVFLRLDSEYVDELSVAELDSSDLIHAFPELYDVIEKYVAKADVGTRSLSSIKWISSSSRITIEESYRFLLSKLFGSLF